MPQIPQRVDSGFYLLPPVTELDPLSAIDALYVHVPFCTSKCHYCDFFSLAGHLEQADAFLNAIAGELELQVVHFGRPTPETIFIGGGTPTLLPPHALARLLEIINNSINTQRLVEFTVEANPNTFDAARAKVLRDGGVNRMSFGAQSFSAAELAVLRRDHQPENVPIAVDIARGAGIENINLDLIFGIPGQTLMQWDRNLAWALALNPTHLSCYGLTYEPNTPMTARMKRGEFTPVDDELQIAMLMHACTRLAEAGLARYEISNYARPGCACRHNIHYWHAHNHLAVGPSAAGYHSGFRWKNVPSLTRYLDSLNTNPATLPITEMEHLTGWSRWGELAILQLRLQEGMVLQDFHCRTGVNPLRILALVVNRYADLGLLAIANGTLVVTEAGVAVSDTIFADVLEAFNRHDTA
ncbi:MAG: radical SAM family heme chaperone HemW [Phycisphaerae bacterium]